jgi:hypothetical protein
MPRNFFNSITSGSQQADRSACPCCSDRGFVGRMDAAFGGEWDWCAERCAAARRLLAEVKAAIPADRAA